MGRDHGAPGLNTAYPDDCDRLYLSGWISRCLLLMTDPKRMPTATDPYILFRQCLTLPRPSIEIVSPWPAYPLRVQALSSSELEDLTDRALVRFAVIGADGSPAFDDRLLDRLFPRELEALSWAVRGALERFPCLGLSDLSRWRRILREGAQDPRNQVAAHALGSSFELTGSGEAVRMIDRPDRFFGVPTRELIDCHWLAYWAARNNYLEETKRT